MDTTSAEKVVAHLERRGEVDRLDHVDVAAARVCLDRATERLRAARVLFDADLWETAFTTAYDAYRTAADAVVLRLGCRVRAVPGSHRIVVDIAHAALRSDHDPFSPASAERFRQGRNESEYFDPQRPIDKSRDDARWAVDLAHAAVDAVSGELSGR